VAFDPEEDGQFRFRRSIYAALVDSAPIATPFYENYTWNITAEELI
jgi:hypothetical protein